MNHEEAELGRSRSAAGRSLTRPWRRTWSVPRREEPRPQHRRRHDNGGGRPAGRAATGWRRRTASGRTITTATSPPRRPVPPARCLGGAGSRSRGQRRSVEETEVEQQQQQPLPRPGVTRYRRQGDNEARLRAQQQRQQQRQRQMQQREAERPEPQPQAPPPQTPPPTQAPPTQREDLEEDEEGGDSALARSASTESGFHNHTDRAEGDVVMEPDGEDESVYSTPYRPEAEEYTESAEAEQHGGSPAPASAPPPATPTSPPSPTAPVPSPASTAAPGTPPNVDRPLTQDAEALNPTYSSYVYTQQLYRMGGAGGRGEAVEGADPEDEPYAEPYADYGAQEHVYRQQEAVGSRLHHYDERSDGESDSPEKEAEFAPYPRMDSCEQEEDIDQIVAEVKESLSSQSLDRAAGDWPESEGQPGDGDADAAGAHGQEEEEEQHQEEEEEEAREVREEVEEAPEEEEAAKQPPQEEEPLQRHSREKRDAISLAIKDIKEAIEEVKTRTVRSPYTPDEPTEPIWVMRQDLSPTGDCDLQPPLGADSPGSGSTSPQGAESSGQHPTLHESSDSFESPSPASKEPRRSLASFPTYVEVPGPCDPEDLIDGIIFAANYLGSTQLLSDKTPSKNVRMMQAQEAVSRIKTAQKLAKNRKKAPEGEAQPMTEVDLFISTQRIRVLNADTQETMMDHPLRTISYIADIGNIVVLMARRRMARSSSQENVDALDPAQEEKRQYKMICHVFESEDAQLIAQSIGQAFSVAYQEFLRANGPGPEPEGSTSSTPRDLSHPLLQVRELQRCVHREAEGGDSGRGHR
ncbi:hypothetical protein ANANG_G00197560 [Anguilla anguilla]|uniref:PID domain-containing protein n=1 Tax=Anguilla anguilla TaxID=7936 RepID=A0A9D3M3K5_ANGAN|nr:hypothetical protein ANANG_G00197560 [Anguilla anguilla]